MQLFRSLSRLIVCSVLALALGACAAGPTAGLQSYQSPDGRFAFLYPTGWTQVQVSNGPRVVFHDLIHSDETVSLMINKVSEDNELSELGSAVAVGERLRREVIATATALPSSLSSLSSLTLLIIRLTVSSLWIRS